MKIDDYIRHLELQCKGLRRKQNELLKEEDKVYLKKSRENNYDKVGETRERIRKTNKKIDFLKNLKEEMIKNEMQNKTSKQR